MANVAGAKHIFINSSKGEKMISINDALNNQITLVKNWINQHPDEKIPKFGTKEFYIFWEKATKRRNFFFDRESIEHILKEKI